MLEVTAAGWAATLGLIAALLAVDLFASGRRPHAVGFREAAGWSVFYIAIAVLFGVVFGVVAGWDFGAQYFAGYVVEKSLSVDNLFVFVIIMSTFAVPAEHQQRVLTFGILLALVLRAVFIALGAALLSLFSFMFLIFGLLLIATAVQLFRHRDEDPSVEDNVLVAVARRRLPFTDRYDGGRLVTRRDGRRVLTPLSWCSSRSAPPTSCSPSTRSRRSSASAARRSSSSPRTRSRCWGCVRCTSSSPACSTGSCTCPRAWR